MDLWPKMGALGVLGVTVEEDYGGAAMGYLAHMIAMEEIQPCQRFGRPVLRRAQQPVREPDPGNGNAAQKAEVPAQG